MLIDQRDSLKVLIAGISFPESQGSLISKWRIARHADEVRGYIRLVTGFILGGAEGNENLVAACKTPCYGSARRPR